jgi:hypothetical protein
LICVPFSRFVLFDLIVFLFLSSRADLIVGAPFYYDREAGGAVYVYSNPPDGGLTADTTYVKLVGKPESRYAYTVGKKTIIFLSSFFHWNNEWPTFQHHL